MENNLFALCFMCIGVYATVIVQHVYSEYKIVKSGKLGKPEKKVKIDYHSSWRSSTSRRRTWRIAPSAITRGSTRHRAWKKTNRPD